jgi:hypothetical protein
VGAPEGADTGNQIRNAAPAGRPVGPPRGGIDLSFLGGLGGRSPPDFCYLDNIEITEANRQILLLCPSFMPLKNF